MKKDYEYSSPKSKLPSWANNGDKVQVVRVAKTSAWYGYPELIGAKGTFKFLGWYGGAWFSGNLTLEEDIKGKNANWEKGESISMSRVCLRKLNNLTR